MRRGALSALLIAGAIAPAPASAWRGTDSVNGDDGLATTNEEDGGPTAGEGSDAEAPPVTAPDTPDEAEGAAVAGQEVSGERGHARSGLHIR